MYYAVDQELVEILFKTARGGRRGLYRVPTARRFEGPGHFTDTFEALKPLPRKASDGQTLIFLFLTIILFRIITTWSKLQKNYGV